MSSRAAGRDAGSDALTIPSWFARQAIQVFAVADVATRVRLRVLGRRHLPRRGPALIVSRHFHHLHDACILMAVAPRPLAFVVALDWLPRPLRLPMEFACRVARWPALLRPERLSATSAYRPEEARHYLRRALADSVSLLRRDGALVIFPEAYPNIDPGYTPKADEQAFLPFQPGFIRLMQRAERDGRTSVPIIPAGFAYERGRRWRVTLRFGAPLYRRQYGSRAELLQAVEAAVRRLSVPAQRHVTERWASAEE